MIVTNAITTRAGNETGIEIYFSIMLSSEIHAIPELIVRQTADDRSMTAEGDLIDHIQRNSAELQS